MKLKIRCVISFIIMIIMIFSCASTTFANKPPSTAVIIADYWITNRPVSVNGSNSQSIQVTNISKDISSFAPSTGIYDGRTVQFWQARVLPKGSHQTQAGGLNCCNKGVKINAVKMEDQEPCYQIAGSNAWIPFLPNDQLVFYYQESLDFSNSAVFDDVIVQVSDWYTSVAQSYWLKIIILKDDDNSSKMLYYFSEVDIKNINIKLTNSNLKIESITRQFTHKTIEQMNGASFGVDLIHGNATVIIKLTDKPQTYCVEYDLNGGSSTSLQLKYENLNSGDNTPIIEAPTKKDYVFIGYTPEWKSTVTSNVIYTAQWKRTDQYSVTYRSNGATSGNVPVDSNSPYASDALVKVLANSGNLKKDGYTFIGWNTNSDRTGISYVEGNSFNIIANTTLYAQWEKLSYTVTYINDDGTELDKKRYKHGDTLIEYDQIPISSLSNENNEISFIRFKLVTGELGPNNTVINDLTYQAQYLTNEVEINGKYLYDVIYQTKEATDENWPDDKLNLLERPSNTDIITPVPIRLNYIFQEWTINESLPIKEGDPILDEMGNKIQYYHIIITVSATFIENPSVSAPTPTPTPTPTAPMSTPTPGVTPAIIPLGISLTTPAIPAEEEIPLGVPTTGDMPIIIPSILLSISIILLLIISIKHSKKI